MAKYAAQLVLRVRELLQLVEGLNVRYRDGFTGDADTSLTPILPTVNEFLSVCSLTGIKAQDSPVGVVAGTREYGFASGIARILSVYYAGVALRQTTRQALDQMEPAWTASTGTPTRYFREGNRVVLDKRPTTAESMVLRAGYALTPFSGTDTNATLDDAIPDTAAERLPYGAAYLQVFVDAEELSHGRRVQSYKSVAEGVLQELGEASDTMDYAAPVSLDEWAGPLRRPLPAAEDYLHYKSPRGD